MWIQFFNLCYVISRVSRATNKFCKSRIFNVDLSDSYCAIKFFYAFMLFTIIVKHFSGLFVVNLFSKQFKARELRGNDYEFFFFGHSGERLVVNVRPKAEKKSSVGSTWWNWKKKNCPLLCCISLKSSLHRDFCWLHEFSFDFRFLFSVYVYTEVTRLMGDFHDNLTLTWREGRRRKKLLVNQSYPCVCIRNDFVNPCEEPGFWWDFFCLTEMILVLSSRFIFQQKIF